MDHYQDINLYPNGDIPTATVLNQTFGKLHLALVNYGKGDIGVSFPKADKTLGETLRLHGTHQALSELEQMCWREHLDDYCSTSSIKAVPSTAQWRVVSRVQTKSSPERLLRRSVKKGWISEQEAQTRLKEAKDKTTKLPFLRVKSLSNGQFFRLFIKHHPCVDAPCNGTFNTYGLSDKATIPWF